MWATSLESTFPSLDLNLEILCFTFESCASCFSEVSEFGSHHMCPAGFEIGAHAPLMVGTTTRPHVDYESCCVSVFPAENSREFSFSSVSPPHMLAVSNADDFKSSFEFSQHASSASVGY